MKQIKFFLLFTIMTFTFFSCSEDNLGLEDLNQPTIEEHTHTSIFGKRTCSSHEHMQELLSDPAYKAAREKRMEKYMRYKSQNVNQRSTSCNNPTVLPIAIHYQGIPNPNASCLIALAQSQIQALNKDFRGTNSDISNWSDNAASSFPGISNGEACLSFQIADKNHPAGYGLQDGDLAVTINKTNGDLDNKWSGYLNMYIQFGTGVLGYAPLGGAGNGDGVVIEATAFGVGGGCGSVSPAAPYNLGRTTTHEVGHYLNLDHIWGGGCGQDDGVADTPNSDQEYYDCPNVGENSCGSVDMHMNYMDYTNDACMYMFSAGQATVVENYVSASLSLISNNASNVISGANNENDNDDSDNDDNSDDDDSSNDDDNDNSGNDDDNSDDNDNSDNSDNSDDSDDDSDNTACDKASELVANVTGETTASISWTGYNSAIRYKLRYKEVSGGRYTRMNTKATNASLEGLIADTEYQYQVRVRCSTGWTNWTATEYFTTDASNDEGGTTAGCTDLNIEVTTDDYGNETSWYIVDEYGDVVAEGGPYDDGYAGDVFDQDVCLPDGCYTLTIADEYGDGLCCSYGDGGLVVTDNSGSVQLSSDGNFGSYEDIDFCISNTDVQSKGVKNDAKKTSARQAAKYTRK